MPFWILLGLKFIFSLFFAFCFCFCYFSFFFAYQFPLVLVRITKYSHIFAFAFADNENHLSMSIYKLYRNALQFHFISFRVECECFFSPFALNSEQFQPIQFLFIKSTFIRNSYRFSMGSFSRIYYYC